MVKKLTRKQSNLTTKQLIGLYGLYPKHIAKRIKAAGHDTGKFDRYWLGWIDALEAVNCALREGK